MKNAIILAAGIGERAVPLTYELPKGMIKVFGQPMIERQIEQLIEAGLKEIVIVTGYMQERFDYLVEKYGVKLIFNPNFANRNNLESLYMAREYLGDSYILVSDNYLTENIFSSDTESLSWFSCPFYEGESTEWLVTEQSENGAIREISIGGKNAYAIQGPAYFTPEFSCVFKIYLEKYRTNPNCYDYYWEHILKNEISRLPDMLIKDTTGVLYEFENLEELRSFDKSYMTETENYSMRKIAEVFGCSQGDVYGIERIAVSMSNNSFKFFIDGKSYVFRLPGADTGKLVNRKIEKEAYDALSPFHITDEVIYLDGDSGIKIAKFIDNSHNSDPFNDYELRLSMECLKDAHSLNITLSENYDIESKTKHYVALAKELNAIRFPDFDETEVKIRELYKIVSRLNVDVSFCHGDFAHVNLLVTPDGTGKLIDLEFCGNGDPLMDVAMYALFAQFDKKRVDLSLRFYLGRTPVSSEYLRLYLYVSASAFLWTAWSEYKQANGCDYGNYTPTMYKYAKEYYNLCMQSFKIHAD